MKRKRSILPVLTVACTLALMGMTLALILGGQEAAAFTPPAPDSLAVRGIPAVPEERGYSSPHTEEVDYCFALCGNVYLDGASAVVYFTNPAENQVWLRLCVQDKNDRTLGETGLIRPGEYVRAVALDKPPAAGTPVKLRVMGCEPETYRSAGTSVMHTPVCGIWP